MFRSLGFVLVAGLTLLIAGCGGSDFGAKKTIHDPFSTSGRFSQISLAVGGDALVRSFVADTPRPPATPAQAFLTYSFGNTVDPGQYAGLDSVKVNQTVLLRFSFSPNVLLPSTINLRSVMLRMWLRVEDVTEDATPRQSRTVEMVYNGSLTLERDVDGTYVARPNLLFSTDVGREAGAFLLNMLGTGSANTVVIDLSFRAETSSATVPINTIAQMSVHFLNSNAEVQW